MKPLNLIIFLLFAAFVGGAYYSGRKSVIIPPCPEPEIEIKWLTKYDTIKPPPKTIYVPVHDTILVKGVDTIKTLFAKLDTMLYTGDSLSLTYLYNPSSFDLGFWPSVDSIPYIVQTYHDTVTIQGPLSWYNDPLKTSPLAMLGGILLGLKLR